MGGGGRTHCPPSGSAHVIMTKYSKKKNYKIDDIWNLEGKEIAPVLNLDYRDRAYRSAEF